MKEKKHKIKRNRCLCVNCGIIIESKHVHDWVSCNCYSNSYENTGIFTDGGTEYIRRGGVFSNIVPLDEYEEEKNLPT